MADRNRAIGSHRQGIGRDRLPRQQFRDGSRGDRAQRQIRTGPPPDRQIQRQHRPFRREPHKAIARNRRHHQPPPRSRQGSHAQHRAPHQTQALARWHGQGRPVQNSRRLRQGKRQPRWIAQQIRVLIGSCRLEPKFPRLTKAHTRGRGGREGSGHIQPSIGPKHQTRRIHQKQIGVTTADLDESINSRWIAPHHTPQNVAQVRRGQEIRNFLGVEIKPFKAVEQVGPIARSTATADIEAIALGSHHRARAVGRRGDRLGPNRPRVSTQAPDRPKTRNSRN